MKIERRIEFFMRRVQKTETCWLWIGPLDQYGYARTRGQFNSGHALAYFLFRGTVPAGLELDHLCNVRHCVNPDHLEPVTHAENARRASERQTHCSNGHEYTEENTYRRPKSGHRDCRECIRIRARRHARRAA